MARLFSSSDLTLALRLVRKQPIVTGAAIAALATGIFLATTGFTFLEAVLWARLPFAGGDRFVLVEAFAQPQARRIAVEYDRFETLRYHLPALQHVGAFGPGAQNLLLPDGEVALVAAVTITGDSFAFLPYTPLLGRTLVRADETPGAAAVVVSRESLWRRHFSADPAVIGRQANFSGVRRTIVGVLPDAAAFPTSPEAWLPLGRGTELRVFGVLTHTDALVLAQSQANAVSKQFDEATLTTEPRRLVVMPFVDALSRGLELLTGGLVFVLVLVLLVVAANVANLVLARTLSRSTELAIRSALGAPRARLVAQVFVEVLVIGSIASVIGVAATQATLAWIRGTMTEIPFWVDFRMSPVTVAFVVCITLVASAIAGVLPALRVTRRQTAVALAQSTRSIARGFGFVGSAMVALQVALSIAALHAALVVGRGVAGYMQGAPAPLESQVLTARVVVPEALTPADAHARIRDAIARLPSVRNVGLSTSLPRLSPDTVMTSVRSTGGEAASTPRAAPVVAISRGYFETLGGAAVTGRLFDDNDFAPSAAPVAIVNQPFAEKFFGGSSPLGRQLGVIEADKQQRIVWREIVGVVPDLGLSSGDSDLAAGFYVPLQRESVFHLSLSSGDSRSLAREVRRAVAAADARIQIHDVRPLSDVGSEDRAVFAGIGGALTGLGTVALLLSVMGVYAMLSFTVTQRTREVAIRTALGASGRRILASLLAHTAVPFLAGILLGPVLGQLLVSARGIFAFRLPASGGPWAAPLLSGVMLIAAVLAGLGPARRALAIDTADALKAD
jgi:putative ABC transport system permease protein